jgi:hypothetical protein
MESCLHHGLPFLYFCEPCLQPVCRDCCINGPHNNELHQFRGLAEAFEDKHSHLQRLMGETVIPRRKEIEAAIKAHEAEVAAVRREAAALTECSQAIRSETGYNHERATEGLLVRAQACRDSLESHLFEVNDLCKRV